MKKILLVSSSGGHYEQLLVLKRKLSNNYNISVITEKIDDINKESNTFYIHQINRKNLLFPFYLCFNHIKIKRIIKTINPDVIISTGALSTISSCLLGKRFNKKTIFIESFAKVKTPTKTGKFLYGKVDYFIVQWPELKNVYPNSFYFGGIY